ncbi:MAG: hypothetical protein Q9166_002359 [cf. Caloplaca sp. 2 TL-2023]
MILEPDQYIPFSTITQRSLHQTLSENDLSMPSEEILTSLMSAYDALSTFPDVTPALESLAKSPSITPVVFSNGTQEMVHNSVYRSPDLLPYSEIFRMVVTIEDTRKFKPHPDVYYDLVHKVGKDRDRMDEVWLVSGNPFDVVGAKAVGMKACWVNRTANRWTDNLIQGEEGKPDLTVKGLDEVVERISMAQKPDR